jgi:zinc protease
MNRQEPRYLLVLAAALTMTSVVTALARPLIRDGGGSRASETGQAALPTGVTRAASVEGITEYRLTNGLRVLLIPDGSKPAITVNITYLVGSRNENYGETGMAHLLEHLMFKGTPTHPHVTDEMTAHGSQVGATLESPAGLSNGTTRVDRTNYYETFPASESNLKWAVELEADRMINSFISKKDLDSEMTVVRNELERDHNNPLSILMERAQSAAYEWHSYGKETLGAPSDIENVPIARIQAFYHRYYQPDNAVLIIAGKFEPSKALSLTASAFGAIPRPSRVIEPSYTLEPPQDGEREVTVRRVADTQAAAVGYHIPAGPHPDMAAIQILARILSDPPSGRLCKLLNANAEGTLVISDVLFQHDPGMALFITLTGKQTPVNQARAKMIDAIEGLTAAPPAQEEVDRARTAELKAMTDEFESTTAISIGLSEWIAIGDWRLFFVYRDMLKKVSAADVARVAEYYFKPSNRTVATLVPTDKPNRTEVPATPDSEAIANSYKGASSVISEGEAFDPTPANIQARLVTGSLPGGLKLALLPKKTRGGTVAATLTLNFGDAASLNNLAGAAFMTQLMLLRGTTTHTAQQIADELNKLNAQVRPSLFGASSVSLSIQTTRDNFRKVLALIAEILQHPSFEPDEFEKIKALLGTALPMQQGQPDVIAGEALVRYFSSYQPGDPRYPVVLSDLAAACKAATLDQVKDFHDKFYGASNAELVVVGDFEPDEVKQQAESLLGSWKSPRPFERLSQNYKDAEAVHKSFETPDKTGASLAAAMTIRVSQQDGDYPALVLANFMIGGGFLNSRLEKRIRGKEGLAYAVGSSLAVDPRDKAALFSIGATCAPQNISKLEAAAKEEMERILKEGFSNEEVEAAKKGYLEAQRVNLASDSTLAATLAADMDLGRSIEWDAGLYKQIEALTPDQLTAAVRRYIDPAKLSVFKAGDFAKGAGK